MKRCLICNEIIEDNFNTIFNKDILCYECLNSFKIRNERFIVNGVEGKILYYYDDFFKDLLYRYKGCYDYVLKDCFINYKFNWLKNNYKKYKIVLAPSSKESERKRGFNHLEEIFKNFNLEIIKCFKKDKEWKQSDKKIEERKDIQNVIKIDKSKLKGVKRVLIVDDVLTSGSTIKTMIKQIPTHIDKKVLVLSSNCRILANEIV